ncbi:hypothetical protein BX667DRAFT_501066 [Coemansia mojavensis]|nr:hypothetical protein BX667DRAFT_501066 [Coemansia mojavensis]
MKLFSLGCIVAASMLLSISNVEAQPVRLERRDPVSTILHYVIQGVSNTIPKHEQAPVAQPPYADAAAERRMLCLVNKERRRLGLHPLRSHPAMTKAAYEHSLYQSRVSSMTHSDPKYGQLGSRLQRSGFSFSTAAENIAEAPAASPEEVFQMWMNDPAHYENMVNPQSTYMGLACVDGFWTQDFGSEQDSAPSQYEAHYDTC